MSSYSSNRITASATPSGTTASFVVNSSTRAPRLRVSLALEMIFSYTCFWVASAITGTPSVIRLMVPCFSSPAA